MKAIAVMSAFAGEEDLAGRILCHDLSPRLRKGTVLGPQHLEEVRAAGEVHLVELEPGDVHEDDAARRLAAALCSPGLDARGPLQSQMRLHALTRGLLRVDAGAVDRINRLGPASVFTLVDGQAVDAGEEIAGCKVTPVAVPRTVLETVEAICREAPPVLSLIGFRSLRTFVVVTEKLKPRARQIFAAALTKKLGWYGAELLQVREVERSGDHVRAAYREALSSGAELILFAGASSIDPLDPAYRELSGAGGELLHLGAPAHPGSMLWLGSLGAAAVLGIASCAGFGRNTSLDLLLPFVFAYGRPHLEDVVRLGHGGLIESSAGRRFPPYT